jgi:hypothetical protein
MKNCQVTFENFNHFVKLFMFTAVVVVDVVAGWMCNTVCCYHISVVVVVCRSKDQNYLRAVGI